MSYDAKQAHGHHPIMLLDPTLTAAYIVVAAALAFAPGPDFMFVLANSLRHKMRGAVAAALGIGAGSLVHTVAAAIGISAVIAASPVAFEVLRYGGAAYLLYLGIKSILAFRNASSSDGPEQSEHAASVFKVFKQGLITNILNPKVVIFYIALLPQFVNISLGHVGLQIVLLGCIHAAIGLVYLVCMGALAGSAASWVRQSSIGRWLDAIAGVLFVGLALRLALSGRE